MGKGKGVYMIKTQEFKIYMKIGNLVYWYMLGGKNEKSNKPNCRV